MSLSPQFPKESTVIIAAFGGWNDASQSATGAVDHLLEVWENEEILDLPGDDYYDYAFSRPEVETSVNGERIITWPGTNIYRATCEALPHTSVYLVVGEEPNMRWRQFCDVILKSIITTESTVLIALGALLAGVAHTRPVPVLGSTHDAALQEMTGFGPSHYDGPTGIVGVMQSEFSTAGIPSLSLWAEVPHYAAQPPCPKATLAILRQLEDVLDISIPMLTLEEDARAWQDGAEAMSTDDEEIIEYIRSLEESQDTAELPEASGEAIAREFERYLRRRER